VISKDDRPIWFKLLERLTGTVLVLVLLSLGWMIAVVAFPEAASRYSTEIEVFVVLGLLTAALGLVSLVALVHTRTPVTRRDAGD
jgi:hypothetical protein